MTVIEACDGEEALGVIDANERGEPDVVLLDYHLPKLTGEQVLRQARTIRSDLPIIMITGHGSIEHAVKMTKAGASDYLCKPLRRERVLQVVQEAIAKKSGGKTTEGVATSPRQMLKHLMGNSQSIQQLANEVERVAPTAYSVLLMGETGVGKEVVAKAIHSGSEMSGNELVATVARSPRP
jgi:DNA-binding NtrC family response regulator